MIQFKFNTTHFGTKSLAVQSHSDFLSFQYPSMPFDAWTPIGFGITVAIELFVCQAFLTVFLSYMAFYYTICTYVDSFIDDFGSIISYSNKRIQNGLSMKKNLVELVEHHLHGYR